MVVGAISTISGILLLGATWSLDYRLKLVEQAQQAATARHKPTLPKLETNTASFLEGAPPHSAHLHDLMQLFAVAKSSGVTIGSVSYRIERNSSLPVVVRTVDLRVNVDYPRLKGFIAKLLVTSPYVTLQEMRMERKEVGTQEGLALLRLSYIYKAAPAPAPAPAPAAAAIGS